MAWRTRKRHRDMRETEKNNASVAYFITRGENILYALSVRLMWMRNFLPENTQEEREGKKETKIWDDGEEKKWCWRLCDSFVDTLLPRLIGSVRTVSCISGFFLNWPASPIIDAFKIQSTNIKICIKPFISCHHMRQIVTCKAQTMPKRLRIPFKLN